MTFDVTVPVLNEAETLERQIDILYRFLQEHFPDPQQWRIVIADNGSTDATADTGRRLEEELPGVHLLQVDRRGVGLALKTSWQASEADIVGYMDLDLATDLRHFPEAYAAIAGEGYDVVYGTRLHPQAKVVGRSLKREITSQVFNWLLSVYLGVDFSDGMCGFKWLRREHVPALLAGGAQSDGWFFSTELLTVAERRGLRIKELPVHWTDDVSSSRVRIWPLAMEYLRAMRVLKEKISTRMPPA